MRYKVGATLCALIECLSIGRWGGKGVEGALGY